MMRFDSDSENLPEGFPKGWRVRAESLEKLLEGEFYPSVTTILDIVVDRNGKNFLQFKTKEEYDEIMTNAAQIGTELHELFAHIVDGEEIEVGEYANCLKNFKGIVEKEEIEAILHDVEVHSPLYGYSGEMDMLGKTKGSTCAFEFKSGMYHIKAGWQASAYRAGYIETTGNEVEKMMGIQCHRNGDVKKVFKYVHMDSCFIAFLSALNVWRMCEFNKLMKLKWKWVLKDPTETYWKNKLGD